MSGSLSMLPKWNKPSNEIKQTFLVGWTVETDSFPLLKYFSWHVCLLAGKVYRKGKYMLLPVYRKCTYLPWFRMYMFQLGPIIDQYEVNPLV